MGTEQLSRREFFSFGLKESTKLIDKGLKHKFKRPALRPPGALREEQFLITCTRCGDCKTACPHDAIHMVDLLKGGVNAGTPFIDPYYAACQYCEDMPCLSACEPEALRKDDEKQLKLGTALVELRHCLVKQGQYCDYCFNTCPQGVSAISKHDGGYPVIDAEACVGCGKCAYICVSQTGKAIAIEPL